MKPPGRLFFLTTLVCLLCAIALCAPPPGLAQDASPQRAPELRAGQYVVRPGDTLRSLAEKYLGSEQRWEDIWQLNRKLIANPDALQPGWLINIYWRELPLSSAVLTNRWNEVESRRPPLDWSEALINDVMARQDRIQTYGDSSAELTFGDSSTLRINEESMVLLDPTSNLGTTVARESVEILQGQADLEGSSLDPSENGIELVVGNATARPQPSDSGVVQTRVRKTESAAQLMVYEGASKLEAAGSTVQVDEGMGSSVPEGAPPQPPEKLLEAPAVIAPSVGARLPTPRPMFRWSPVPGAVSYRVEICRDAECGQLEKRSDSMTEATWQPTEKLPTAVLFWRVNATSPSGLDGYPSEAREFTVLTGDEDQQPPTVGFRVTPPRLAPRSGLNRHWILGVGARFEAVAEDPQSGLDRWIPLLDGQEVSVEQWQAGPWPTGEMKEASFTAIDRATHRTTLEPVPFVFDDQPPALTWGQEQVGRLGQVKPLATPRDSWPTHTSLRALESNDPHSIWPWRKQTWSVEKDPRQVVLRPNRPVWVRIEGREMRLTPERGIWLLAEDAICDSIYRLNDDLDLQTVGKVFRRSNRLTLQVEAHDWVGNASTGELTIETLGRKQRDAQERE